MDMRHQFDPADCPAAPARPRRSAWKRALIDVPTYPRRVEDSRSLLVPRAEALPEARRRAIARTVREERASLGARARDDDGAAAGLGRKLVVALVGVTCGAGLAQALVTGLSTLARLIG